MFGVYSPAMENRPCSSSQNWPLKQRNENLIHVQVLIRVLRNSAKSTFPSQVYRYQGQTIISRIFGCVCVGYTQHFSEVAGK